MVAGSAAAGLVALAAVAVVTVGSGSAPAEAATPDGATATALVARRDLVLRDDVDGTLGYADARTLTAGAPGVVTRLPEEGKVVTRGKVLYEVDAAGVRLLYGTMPLWRRLGPKVADGRDVEQLERNLVELGHDPQGMTVDETFDDDTAAAVRSWQEALGFPRRGRSGRKTPSSCRPARAGSVSTRPRSGRRSSPGLQCSRSPSRPRSSRSTSTHAARSSRASARRCGWSSRPGAP